jgi:hypothetical protein
MYQWLRFSSVYVTSMDVTANNPKIVSGFTELSSEPIIINSALTFSIRKLHETSC